jgi:hypothetical protein
LSPKIGNVPISKKSSRGIIPRPTTEVYVASTDRDNTRDKYHTSRSKN